MPKTAELKPQSYRVEDPRVETPETPELKPKLKPKTPELKRKIPERKPKPETPELKPKLI